MGKFVFMMFLITGVNTFSSQLIGIVTNEDLIAVGVPQENISKVRVIIEQANVQYKMRLLDKEAIEIEIKKYILLGSEENLGRINNLLDKLGVIESEMRKDRLKYQIEVRKYITTEQYMKARNQSIKKR